MANCDKRGHGCERHGNADSPRDKESEPNSKARAPQPSGHLGLSLRRQPQHVADAPNGVDQARLAASLCLASEVSDVHLQGVRVRPEVVPPYAIEDQLAWQNLLGIAEQELQQQKLRAGQL